MRYVRFSHRPELHRPTLLCAFSGWNDGGEAATSAVSYLRDRWEAEPFADLDPEDFLDFQVTRPTVRWVEGMTRRIEWPQIGFSAARPPGCDVAILLGHEPNLRWRTFAGAILDTAREIGAERIVTLGAYLADIPHTVAPGVTGSASDPDLAARLGLASSGYEGPTGIVGILHDAAGRAGFQSASLWSASPHYLPGEQNPRATLALVEMVSALIGAGVDTGTLERAVGLWEARVNALIDGNDELAAYVRRLEDATRGGNGADADEPGRSLPTGEDIAAQLERYLRERRDEA